MTENRRKMMQFLEKKEVNMAEKVSTKIEEGGTYNIYHANTWINGDDSRCGTRKKVKAMGRPRKLVLHCSSYFVAAYSVFTGWYKLNPANTDFMVVRIEGYEQRDGTFGLMVNNFKGSSIQYKSYELVDTIMIEKT